MNKTSNNILGFGEKEDGRRLDIVEKRIYKLEDKS